MEPSIEKILLSDDERRAALERIAVRLLGQRGQSLDYADFIYQKVSIEGFLGALVQRRQIDLKLLLTPPGETEMAAMAFAAPSQYLWLREISGRATPEEAAIQAARGLRELTPDQVDRIQAPFLKAGYRPAPSPEAPPREPPGDGIVRTLEEERRLSIELGRAERARSKADYDRYFERSRALWERYRAGKLD